MDKYKEVDENELLFDIYIFMVTPTPTPSVPYSGLQKSIYNGYFYDNPNFFSKLPVSVSIDNGILEIDKFENPEDPLYDTVSTEWLGYFTPNTTETYTFYLKSDDGSYLWLGDIALNGYTTENALVNNGGTHGAIEKSGSISLISGSVYPIRIQFGDEFGIEQFTASYSTDTISKTTDFSGLLIYAPFDSPIPTSTPTPTPTLTSTPAPSSTLTPTPTPTKTSTPTLTSTPTPTLSITSTPTPTPTPTPAISNQRPSKPTCSKPNTLPLIPYKIQIKHGGIPASNWNISWEVIQKDSGAVLYSGSFDKDKVVVDLIDENNYLSATTSDKKGIYLPNTRFRTYSYILL